LELVQEELRSSPWLLLQASVLLNRTRGEAVQGAMEALFARWPTSEAIADAEPSEVAAVLKPLGLQNRRAKSLVALARRWEEILVSNGERPVAEDLTGLPGIGAYALDSYRIFVDGVVDDDAPRSGDLRLTSYCVWARTGQVPPEASPKPTRPKGAVGSQPEGDRASAGSEGWESPEGVLQVLEALEGWQSPGPDGKLRPVTVSDARKLASVLSGRRPRHLKLVE
jgi:hypothetical protein